jgi:serine/threonine protein kinase
VTAGPTHERAETSTGSQYELLCRLATGGMAEIFIARVTTAAGVQRHVVLKRIKPERSGDPRFVRMFLREAHLAAQLQHPNIAQVYDIGRLDGAYFFTMEYVHGETVRALLQRTVAHRRAIPIAHILNIISGAAAGLHHAHELTGPDRKPLGVVHRDVSPSNLMMSLEGTVKVVDFGVAKALIGTSETQTGGIKGKINYLSPEQCRGRSDIDRRSDLFSLGIVLYEMLTAKRLFRRATDFDSMSAIVFEDVPPPSTLRPEIPAELDQIALRLLAKRPADRYATAGEVLEELEALAAGSGFALSQSALGRYLRELFGDRPAPWLELDPAEAKAVTVSTERVSVTFEPAAVPLASAPAPAPVALDPASAFAAEVPTLSTHQHEVAADNPFAPDPVPSSEIPPLARPLTISSTGPIAERAPVAAAASAPIPFLPPSQRNEGWYLRSGIVLLAIAAAVGVALVAVQSLGTRRRDDETSAPADPEPAADPPAAAAEVPPPAPAPAPAPVPVPAAEVPPPAPVPALAADDPDLPEIELDATEVAGGDPGGDPADRPKRERAKPDRGKREARTEPARPDPADALPELPTTAAAPTADELFDRVRQAAQRSDWSGALAACDQLVDRGPTRQARLTCAVAACNASNKAAAIRYARHLPAASAAKVATACAAKGIKIPGAKADCEANPLSCHN